MSLLARVGHSASRINGIVIGRMAPAVCGFSRELSGGKAKPSLKPTEPSSSSSATPNVKNPLGQVYQELVYRGRGLQQLALGDLRKLLEKCETKDDIKYGTQMVELFQRKRQDFSEEVNSHFVSMCIRGEQPELAIKHFAVYKNRIGSWTTPLVLHNLTLASIKAIESKSEIIKSLAVALETITLKGVKVFPDTIKLLLENSKDAESYAKVVSVSTKCLGADATAAIVAAHPAPVHEAAAPAAPAAFADLAATASSSVSSSSSSSSPSPSPSPSP